VVVSGCFEWNGGGCVSADTPTLKSVLSLENELRRVERI